MKALMALIIAFTATSIVYDRAYQRNTFLYQSPQIKQCNFVPMVNYGISFKMRGYFESGKCCSRQDQSCESHRAN